MIFSSSHQNQSSQEKVQGDQVVDSENGLFSQREKVEKKDLWKAFREGPFSVSGTSRTFPKSDRAELFEELFPEKESFISKRSVAKKIKEIERKDTPLARYLKEVTGL
jgi:hypothetical protein